MYVCMYVCMYIVVLAGVCYMLTFYKHTDTHTLMHTPQIVNMHCVFLVVKFGKFAPDQLQGLHL